MPRALSNALDATTRSTHRRPAFRVLIYDVGAADDDGEPLNSVSDVVRNAPDPAAVPIAPAVGPRDFTADVAEIAVEEVVGDAVRGAAASSVVLTLADPAGALDPATLAADPTSQARWLRRGNVVRIVEGDERVPESQWVPTFTGRLVGNAGVLRTRASGIGPVSRITVKAVGREAGFLKFPDTSAPFAAGTAYADMATAVAQDAMGLHPDEIALQGIGPRVTGHSVTQFADEPPLTSIASLLFADGLFPRFDGGGRLVATSADIGRAPDRVYEDADAFLAIETAAVETEPANSVTVVGLDAEQTRIAQPRQELARIGVTAGYFSGAVREDVFWSQDRTALADEIEMAAVSSLAVNGLGIPVGSEGFSTIPAPGPEGTVGATLEIDVVLATSLILAIQLAYIALAAIPDAATATSTSSVGRAREATGLAAALLTMATIGRGTYVFTGRPFEYVFQEIRATAEVAGLVSSRRRELVVENHLVQDRETADSAAARVLFAEQARGNARRVTTLHDVALEPGDVFAVAGRRYLADRIRRTLRRGTAPTAELDCFEITPGSFV